MNHFTERKLILEGKFIGDFAVVFPPQNVDDFEFKALQKAHIYIEKYFDVTLDRFDKEVRSVVGSYKSGKREKFFDIIWEESVDNRHSDASGAVFSLFISFDHSTTNQHQINTYSDLDRILTKNGVPRK